VPDLGPAKADTGRGRTSPGNPREPRVKVFAWLVGADGHAYQLNARDTTIGRNPQSDIRLWDNSTSRSHAKISAEGGVFTIYDLGSVVGTYVNDQRVRRPEHLNAGDVIAFGNATKMTFSLSPNVPGKPGAQLSS
jgi:pSer/pThr/pTyr-binding forkhead associated (FHA) protein